ncbi:MAG: glycosyltransferase [Solirubrobacterales bacterium]|nr:glycosyltransferase [Solirubrobacterales bacterium]
MEAQMLTLAVRDAEDQVGEQQVAAGPAVAHLLPADICRRHHVLPVEFNDGVITAVAPEGIDPKAEAEIREQTGFETRWLIGETAEIDLAIEQLFTGNGQAEPFDRVEFSADDLLKSGLVLAPQLGDMLASRGLVTEEQLSAALAEQERTGDRVGEILVHGGAVEELALLRVLSEQLDLPMADLSKFDEAKAPLDAVPEAVQRRYGCVVFAADMETVYVAVPNILDSDVEAEIARSSGRKVEQFLAPRNEIESLLRRINREAYSQYARYNLRENHPESSAHLVVTGGQKAGLIAGVLVLAAFLVWQFTTTVTVIFALLSVMYALTSLYKLMAGYSALEHRYLMDTSPATLQAMDERDLPMYTILVPLFKEAEVIPYLVAGIESLDYPKTKLDVRLLCEEDDPETLEAILSLDLPPHFNPIVVPASQPQTKPKACNYGLLGAKGEYVVIYDAEDRPDPEQLKKAVLMFEAGDDSIACIQAKLNFFNQQTNMLTRWFSIEYSMLFDLVLPGLDARHDPIPLGGTSNHIKLSELVEVGGWDPYNVTEDADLGVRLHQAGYRTTMMDSTTYEEANTNLGSWVRQRSRWIKGYIQTWLVYMRNPFQLLSSVGFKAFMSFQLLIGGTFIFLINPFFWFLTTLFALTQAGFIEKLFPGWVYYLAAALLFLGNFTFMYLGLAAAARRGDDRLVPYALFFPFYWGLMSIAAWKGFSQLFTNPFYWEKTEHGIDLQGGAEGKAKPTPARGVVG